MVVSYVVLTFFVVYVSCFDLCFVWVVGVLLVERGFWGVGVLGCAVTCLEAALAVYL